MVDEIIGVKIPLSNPERSVVDFGKALRMLFQNSDKLAQLSMGCKERVQEFEWSYKAKKMVEIYNLLEN